MARKELDPEDRFIRNLLITLAAGAVLSFVGLAVVIAVMISYNFNILNWME